MKKKMMFTTAALFLMTFVLLAVRPADAHAGCPEDCYRDCCGDKGICSSDDEQSCVSFCLKDCPDDAPAPSSVSPGNNSGAGDAADSDDSTDPGREHRPVGGSIVPKQKQPDGKQPSNVEQMVP